MLEGSSTWRNSGSGSGVNSSRMSKLHLRAPRRGVGVGSAAWAGPHGRAAACHWAPSARAARAECIAQPSSREHQPRDAVAASCGTTKTAISTCHRTCKKLVIFQTEPSSSRVRPFLKSAVEPMHTDAPRLTCVLSREPGATNEEDASAKDSI